jgi:hypothetical protein
LRFGSAQLAAPRERARSLLRALKAAASCRTPNELEIRWRIYEPEHLVEGETGFVIAEHNNRIQNDEQTRFHDFFCQVVFQ